MRIFKLCRTIIVVERTGVQWVEKTYKVRQNRKGRQVCFNIVSTPQDFRRSGKEIHEDCLQILLYINYQYALFFSSELSQPLPRQKPPSLDSFCLDILLLFSLEKIILGFILVTCNFCA